MSASFTLFDTTLGTCGVVWTARGIIGVHLPETTAAATRKQLQLRFPQALENKPRADIKKVIKDIVLLLQGKSIDLSNAPLDMNGVPAFHQRVYTMARQIPAGDTLSYGELAARVGSPGAARAVGQAMGRNPFPILVPCHRVLAAGGKLGGFSANGGVNTKQRMLRIEGVPITGNRMQRSATRKPIGHPFDVRTALKHLRAADAQLAVLIERIGPFRMEVNETQDLFSALARAIVYQQLHGKAAATIFKRVSDLFPRSVPGFTAMDIKRCTDDRLRAAGLSQNKLLALRDLAGKTLDGSLPGLDELHTLDNEIIIERLSSVRGIGRWTVEMLLIFHLGRLDVLPVDDFGVRKGFALAYNKRVMPTPKQLKAHGARWAPYRSVASWYLWRAADQARPAR